jgi:hypothetical protein
MDGSCKSSIQRWLLIFIFGPILFLLIGFFDPSWSQVYPAGGINYAYSTWVGTGYYDVGDRRVYILRGRLSYPVLEPSEDRKWALDLMLQGTIGFYEFTSEAEDVGAVTAVPGLMFQYPVLDNWRLKPFGQIGLGKDFRGGDFVLIGGGGIKSLADFRQANGIVWELGNSLTIADNSDSDKSITDQGFSMFEIGINRRNPLRHRVFGRQSVLNLFAVYTEFLNDLEFFQVEADDIRIKRLVKFGFAITSEEKFSILGIKFTGGGLDVTLGDNYFGIGWNTGFPF